MKKEDDMKKGQDMEYTGDEKSLLKERIRYYLKKELEAYDFCEHKLGIRGHILVRSFLQIKGAKNLAEFLLGEEVVIDDYDHSISFHEKDYD